MNNYNNNRSGWCGVVADPKSKTAPEFFKYFMSEQFCIDLEREIPVEAAQFQVEETKIPFDDFETDTHEKQRLKETASNFCKYSKECIGEKAVNFLLCGPCGTGKTKIGKIIILDFQNSIKCKNERFNVDEFFTGLYTKSWELMESGRKADALNDPFTRNDFINLYTHPDCLVIDEIGRCTDQFKESHYLFEIIDSRYEAKKATVLISNYSRDALFKHLGNAAVSRLTGPAYRVFDTSGIGDQRPKYDR